MTSSSHVPTGSTGGAGPAPRAADPFANPTQDVPSTRAGGSALDLIAVHIGTRAERAVRRWDAQRTRGTLMGLITAGVLTSVFAAALTARGVGHHGLTAGVQGLPLTSV